MKRLRNAVGRSQKGIEDGSLGSEERLRREFKEAQSLRGLLMLEEICVRKKFLLARVINLETNFDCSLKFARSAGDLVLR